jgi:glycosyltransferase involved in cell wall biosynthesis
MTAAIYYHPEAYTTTGPRLMGRNAAGESFLRGFLRYSKATEFWAQVQRMEHAQHFAQAAKSFARNEPIKAVDKNSLSALESPGVVYYPVPGIGEHAYHRALAGANSQNADPHTAWSLCGITHTTSSAGAMDALASLITAPVQPWDAVICTSTAVKDNVEKLLQAQVNYLQERLGVSKLRLPLLPVIPLGIHTEDFVFTESARQLARQAVEADENALVVLFMGRLSFHAKAHPLAMYQALQSAALAIKPSGKRVVLVECGWHANEHIENAYQEAAKMACPDVQVITLDGRSAQDRQTAWASADVFCSLSDNIQETFGIVPIEAMATGIPVIVSDWDGYKDTVREGVDGFRIATTMPQAGLAGDLAFRHALEIDNYDMYCGHTCSLVAVDVQAAARAFEKLFTSESLRASMGQAGRERARAVYDWAVIIPQYESLWAEQTRLRLEAQKESLGKKPVLAQPWPARMDPFGAFASYPTHTLNENTRLVLTSLSANQLTEAQAKEQAVQQVEAYRQLSMVIFAKQVLPTPEEVKQLIINSSGTPQRAIELLKGIEVQRQAFVFRSLTWLMKLGVLSLAPEDKASS